MITAKYQSDTALDRNFGLVHNDSPDSTTKKLLKFDTGGNIYGLDLEETLEVIRDLMMIQSCNSKSVTRHFIKLNRRNTIVFNLDQCLTLQEKGKPCHKPASFVMLEEKIDDSCVGILVPGVRAVMGTDSPALHASRDKKDTWNIPVHQPKRTSRSSYGKKARDAIPLINVRELVDSCIIHLRFMDSLQHSSN